MLSWSNSLFASSIFLCIAITTLYVYFGLELLFSIHKCSTETSKLKIPQSNFFRATSKSISSDLEVRFQTIECTKILLVTHHTAFDKHRLHQSIIFELIVNWTILVAVYLFMFWLDRFLIIIKNSPAFTLFSIHFFSANWKFHFAHLNARFLIHWPSLRRNQMK